MAQMRAATGGVAAGMSANAAASQLMIAAAGQSYQYTALGGSQLLAQDSTGLGFPVSSQSVCLSVYLTLASHGGRKSLLIFYLLSGNPKSHLGYS